MFLQHYPFHGFDKAPLTKLRASLCDAAHRFQYYILGRCCESVLQMDAAFAKSFHLHMDGAFTHGVFAKWELMSNCLSSSSEKSFGWWISTSVRNASLVPLLLQSRTTKLCAFATFCCGSRHPCAPCVFLRTSFVHTVFHCCCNPDQWNCVHSPHFVAVLDSWGTVRVLFELGSTTRARKIKICYHFAHDRVLLALFHLHTRCAISWLIPCFNAQSNWSGRYVEEFQGVHVEPSFIALCTKLKYQDLFSFLRSQFMFQSA